MKVCVCLCVFFVLCFADDRPSVESKLGVINGKLLKHSFNGQESVIKQFLGIPYAKPPVGELRFKRPDQHGPFIGPFEATAFGSACPQNNMMDIGVDSSDEDCLSLNIYVPTTQADRPSGYAVMVFIHGGGFSVGGSSMVPGEVLTSFGNIILVTINYRLGLFGFANTGDSKAQGNMGLWDQRLAIQWVNEYITAFGGDASRITIFGESAGSMSVFMQGMYPGNEGLFQNIIGESGTPAMPIGTMNDNLASLTYMAEILECPADDKDAMFVCLQKTDAKTIIDKLAQFGKDLHAMLKLQFLPTIDSEFLTRQPLETVLKSKIEPTQEIKTLRTFRVINGINSAEGAMWLPFVLGEEPNPEEAVITHADLKNIHIANILQLITMGQPVPDLLSTLVSSEYTDWQNPSNARNMYVKFMGDLYFNVPGAELSMLHANDSDTRSWLYSFDAWLEKHILQSPSWIGGANHADEMLPLFGYATTNQGPLAFENDYTPPEWELELSKQIMTFWSNFAKYG